MMTRHLTQEDIQKIREEILKGKSKHQVLREMNITDTVVYKYTKDRPNKFKREPYIRGKPLELLKGFCIKLWCQFCGV